MYHLLTGRPPFEASTPSAVMHKHLKDPLIPPDHIITSLSAGVGEIIEVAMAKKREDRYVTTTDMLEDLRALRAGQQPVHARRTVNLEQLAEIQSGKTVDIALPPASTEPVSPWSNPLVMTMAIAAAISLLANFILLAKILTR